MATGITVGEIMRKHVVTITPTHTLQDAMKLMTRAEIGSLVVKTSGRVSGIITEGDIIRALARGKTSKAKVKEVMATPVRMIPFDADLERAGELMRDLKISRLPVVKNKRLVGMITERDMVRVEPALIEMLEEKASIEKIRPEHEGVGISGHCENCNNYTDNLRFVENQYLCEDCRS